MLQHYLAVLLGAVAGYVAAIAWRRRRGQRSVAAGSFSPFAGSFWGGALALILAYLLFGSPRAAPLPWAPEIVPIASRQAFEAVAASPEPVVIDFYAPWCPPCRRMVPSFNRLAGEGVRVAVVDIDDPNNQDIVRMFRVESIPLTIVLRDGKSIVRREGYHSLEELRHLLEDVAARAAM